MANDDTEPVITLFRSRLRADAAANGYEDVAARLELRARAMPGLVEFKVFTAPDGERVSVIVFDTPEHHDAWRDDPEHREAQRRGRDRFYAEYEISVCRPLRRAQFTHRR